MASTFFKRLATTVLAAAAFTAAGSITGAPAADAATVTHVPGSRTVTLTPGSADLGRAANSAAYDEQICSDVWLFTYTRCADQLQACAKHLVSSSTPVHAVFYETGILGRCYAG